MGVLPCEEACPARTAEGSGDEGIRKQDAFSGQTVQMGSPNKGVACTAHEVPSLIVGENENDVRGAASSECFFWRATGEESNCQNARDDSKDFSSSGKGIHS